MVGSDLSPASLLACTSIPVKRMYFIHMVIEHGASPCEKGTSEGEGSDGSEVEINNRGSCQPRQTSSRPALPNVPGLDEPAASSLAYDRIDTRNLFCRLA